LNEIAPGLERDQRGRLNKIEVASYAALNTAARP